MKKTKMTKPVQRLIAVGSLFTSGAAFLHTEFKAIPDFFIGSLMGLGLGLLIAALVWQRRGGSECATSH